MPVQCAWPQPGYWQLRLSALLSFSLGSEAEPFSGIPLSSPLVLQWEGWLEGRLAGEITLMSRYLCTPSPAMAVLTPVLLCPEFPMG